jgi:hypothetical protein
MAGGNPIAGMAAARAAGKLNTIFQSMTGIWRDSATTMVRSE